MKKVVIKLGYENNTWGCEIENEQVPTTMVYRAVCKVKDDLEHLISKEAQEMGINTKEGFDEYMEARFDFERLKLDS